MSLYQNKKISFTLLSIVIVALSSLCVYFITEYSHNLQMGVLNISGLPQSYFVLFKISSTMAAMIPLILCLFIYSSTEMILNNLFCEKIEKTLLFNIIGISYIPMLIYQYVLWYNIVTYCSTSNIKSIDTFVNMKFMYGLTLKDFEYVNLICWGLIYLIPIIILIYKGSRIIPIFIAFILPSALSVLFYNIISD